MIEVQYKMENGLLAVNQQRRGKPIKARLRTYVLTILSCFLRHKKTSPLRSVGLTQAKNVHKMCILHDAICALLCAKQSA